MANANRDYRIFEEFAYRMRFIAQDKLITLEFENTVGDDLFDVGTNIILYDQAIQLSSQQSKMKSPIFFRRIVYYSEEHKRTCTNNINNLEFKVKNVVLLHKNRWQMEFFKWIKQHLHIKSFWGITEYAVKIQIFAAVTGYCLVSIIEHDLQLGHSTLNVVRILAASLFDKTLNRGLLKCLSNTVIELKMVMSNYNSIFSGH